MLDIYFVLVRPKYSGNIGNVARVLKNFGFKNLVLINPIAEIDYEAWLHAVHARDVLYSAMVYSSIQEFMDDKKIKFLIGTTARVGGEKNPLRTVVPSNYIRDMRIPSSKIAVLFGNEEAGLTNEELSYCDVVVTIPTSPEYPAMNISHAVAIVAYEFSIMLQSENIIRQRPSSKLERDILLGYMNKLVDAVIKEETKKEIYKGIIKNMISRAYLTGREIHSLIGFFKRIERILDECRNIDVSL